MQQYFWYWRGERFRFHCVIALFIAITQVILQQQNFLLIWNNNFISIGSNFNCLIIVLFIALLLENVCVKPHNMILK